MSAHQVVARNFAEATENKIHSDEIARKYGFRGALVPGVAVYGHLTRPLVESLGEGWLERSVSDVRFLKPAYDGDRLSIQLTETREGYHVQATNDAGIVLAEMTSAMPDRLPPAQDASVFDAPCKPSERVEMLWDAVHPGVPFSPWHFQITDDGNRTFAEQIADDLPVYHYLAHPHWLLAVANRALTREYLMPAWIHVGSEVRFRSAVRVADTLAVRAVPLEKWERKGHQFVRLYLAYAREHELTTEIFHTAIFRVAE